MKAAVIYFSQTGFTKKYAEWLSEAMGADCLELRIAKKRNLDSYDTIVFGSWACAGRIRKIAWFKSHMEKWSGKRLAVFCTGGSPAESPEIAAFLRSNFSEAEREKVSVFYCPGGFNYEKMPMGSRMMIKTFQKMVSAKKEKTEADREILNMISHSYDISDRKYTEPIVKKLVE